MKQLAVVVIAIFFVGCSQSVEDIKNNARKASVQTVFHVPVLKVSFTEPLPDKEIINKEKLEESLKVLKENIENTIKDLLEENNKLLKEDRYEQYLTSLDVYGVQPPSKTMIPLGLLIEDKDVKFPDKVLVACKTEEKEIKEWEKEYEKDVLAISETANVSPTKAKDIISRLRIVGYTISKEEIAKASEVTLLWYRYGWTGHPATLDWKVEIEGTEDNIIIGYDPIGILETRPIPDGKRVHVVAGFHKLLDKFREKPPEVKSLENKIKDLDNEIKELEKKLQENQKELDKKEDKKRDITQVTTWDVELGKVKLESFWYATAASGTYLGEVSIRDKMHSWEPLRGWWYFVQNILAANASIILTNAHVAAIATGMTIEVSEDKEKMWILFPGLPFIRYTSKSDYYGSPAAILGIDQHPLVAHDIDTAIMITTPVSSMKTFKPTLGDSDNVKEGDSVVMVGNPMLLQKFTTEGVVSNTDYSVLDSFWFQRIAKYLAEYPFYYGWLKNSKFWIDAPIGVGGTSGSGVWTLSGKEYGNLIALHNMGMGSEVPAIMISSEMKQVKLSHGWSNEYLSDYVKTNAKQFIDKDGYKTAKYTTSYEDFIKNNEGFDRVIKQSGRIAGLSGNIPINLVKQYLEERGLDLGIKSMPESHFSQ